MLDVKNVSVAYGKNVVLKDISFSLTQGELISIVGVNGAGKTSLLKSVLQIHKPTAGVIKIEGKEIETFLPRERAKKLAYVPQHETALFPTTVFETILMHRKPYMGWRTGKKDLEKTATLISKMGLEKWAQADMRTLSSGQRQRVQLTAALAQEATYLLLDEPTSNLDLYHQLDVMGQIRQLAHQQKIGILVAVHDLNLACRFSDRILMMKEGHIFKEGLPQEVITEEYIEQVYGVKTHVKLQNGHLNVQPIACVKENKEEK